MLKPGGYATWVDPEAPLLERDTFTCAHCNSIVVVEPAKPPEEMGGFCRMCMKCICKTCDQSGNCVPFERKLEAIEKAGRTRRNLEEVMPW